MTGVCAVVGPRGAVDLSDVYFVEAAGDDTRVRLRSRHVLEDVRRLAELEEILGPAGFDG